MKLYQAYFLQYPFLVVAIILCFKGSAFSQNKIVLTDHSIIDHAEYKAVKNNVIEYLNAGSLHDIEIVKVLWVEQADGSRLYFDENGNAYTRVYKTGLQVTTGLNNQPGLKDSSVLKAGNKEIAKAVYKQEPTERGRVTTELRRAIYYRQGKSDYVIGFIEGKVYGSRLPGKFFSKQADLNKLPFPSQFVNNEEYKKGFTTGVITKQKQYKVFRNVAGGSILTVGLIIATAAFNPYGLLH